MNKENGDILEQLFSTKELERILAPLETRISSKIEDDNFLWTKENGEPVFKWNVHRIESDLQETKRFLLNQDGIDLYFDLDRDFTSLRWDSEIPKNFKPSKTAGEFAEDFEELVFYKLPFLAGEDRQMTKTQTIKSYIAGSVITTMDTSGANRMYYLGDRSNYLQFMVDFCAGVNDLITLNINATYDDIEDPWVYAMTITYPQGSYADGDINFFMPNYTNENSWLPLMSKWALETHKNHNRLSNVKASAIGVSDAIEEIIKQNNL